MNADTKAMELALEEARRAAARDEVPIGAVLVHIATGEIAAANGNRTLELKDPTAHAEILVIRNTSNEAGQILKNYFKTKR
jgi:tRNA(adenine34) deaminase